MKLRDVLRAAQQSHLVGFSLGSDVLPSAAHAVRCAVSWSCERHDTDLERTTHQVATGTSIEGQSANADLVSRYVELFDADTCHLFVLQGKR